MRQILGNSDDFAEIAIDKTKRRVLKYLNMPKSANLYNLFLRTQSKLIA